MNDAALVCVAEDQPAVEGSHLARCADCGKSIWISPTGRQLIVEKNLEAICFGCMPKDAEIAPLEENQIREIKRAWRIK
jgi:hypothetical protein